MILGPLPRIEAESCSRGPGRTEGAGPQAIAGRKAVAGRASDRISLIFYARDRPCHIVLVFHCLGISEPDRERAGNHDLCGNREELSTFGNPGAERPIATK